MTSVYQRPLPQLDESNRFFWLAGEQGYLKIQRCGSCGFWVHPPQPLCTRCLSRDVAPQPVSGLGTVHSYTINIQPWSPGLEVPYVIGSVELDEQKELLITTNLIGVDVNEVNIGMRVKVEFQKDEDIWFPFFRPIVLRIQPGI